jgi:hypothetical protein
MFLSFAREDKEREEVTERVQYIPFRRQEKKP